jgi:hypothetical protein
MRVYNMTSTVAVDNSTGTTPFLDGYTVCAINASAAAVTLEGSDDNVTYTNLVNALAAGNAQDGIVLPRYIKLSAAGVLILAAD